MVKTSMTLGGIGPKLALFCLPYLILSLTVMYRYPEFLDLSALDIRSVKAFGFAWLCVGLIFWASSGIYFMKHFGAGKLIKGGPFALCRNPIYSSLIVFVIPSLGLVFHSGLVLSIAMVLYIGFKLTIHGESVPLRRAFGEEYDKYTASVNEIIPFPRSFLRGKA